jgi:hypothetical protein
LPLVDLIQLGFAVVQGLKGLLGLGGIIPQLGLSRLLL